MASFHSKSFQLHDDYMTPKSAWENIKQYIPQDKQIWEPFYGDGTSGKILSELGFNVIHENIDFFENNKGDIIVSNPPFSKIKEVINRIINELDKPFILIMPISKLSTKYFAQALKGKEKDLQILIPSKRIQFIKIENGKVVETQSNRCNFDCIYYCYKMNLPASFIWLS